MIPFRSCADCFPANVALSLALVSESSKRVPLERSCDHSLGNQRLSCWKTDARSNQPLPGLGASVSDIG